MSSWFTAHKDGLKQIAERLVERRGFGIIAAEMYQNVMDTNAAECVIELNKIPSRPLAELIVKDNDPEGYKDLTHAWTVFAPSFKKEDPTKAGRFNFGEKMVLAFCKNATISTTKGTVEFSEEGRKERPRIKRDYGTEFRALIECNAERYAEFLDYIKKVIVRPNLKLIVNGQVIPPRIPIHTFLIKLPTEIAGPDGNLRRSVRNTEVQVYETNGDLPMLYELGIPVVETGDKWHYNIMQKVPLNIDRDNVTPAYLRDVRVAVFNEMHDKITDEETTSSWVAEATDDEKCSPVAVKDWLVKKFGEKFVSADPTNPEANGEATARGYVVIPSRGMTKGQRENAKRAETLVSSSEMFPQAGKGAYSNDPNALPITVMGPHELTKAMQKLRSYVLEMAPKLINRQISVLFIKTHPQSSNSWGACYGNGELHYNVSSLGEKWFESGLSAEFQALLIHELAHEKESNHSSYDYQEECCRIGGVLAKLIMEDPKYFQNIQSQFN